jgi:hypothetical protein
MFVILLLLMWLSESLIYLIILYTDVITVICITVCWRSTTLVYQPLID